MLSIHRAERADRLLDVLAERVGSGDPFAPDVIAVPTRGIERWVAQQLSRRAGICANVRFPSPRAVVVDAVARASGIDPAEDPWRPGSAGWTLAGLIAEHGDEPWLATVRRHLDRAAEPDGRRLGVGRRLAVLFDRYARHRPEMVLAWARGDLIDEENRELPADLAWQGRLWRALAERLADAPHPAARVESACAAVVADPLVLDLPDRLSVLGITRLPAADLQVLRAIAERREVDLLLLHPSPALWTALSALTPTVRRRAADPTLTAPRHPLLASWGHDVRELQLLLGAQAPSEHHSVELAGTTLLARLQREIQRDAAPSAPQPPAPGDRSVQIHACHGRARQVEVLRDCILGLMTDDPTLEPRDVLVMCPDIEDFAPLISATFGTVDADDERLDLRVRLADRSVRQTNPVLGAVSVLLDLVGGRMPASAVLDFADREPVRRRFGFDDDDLGRLERWVADTGVRWGIEAEHRAPYRLDVVPDGTWRAGLDRVLLGAAVAEDGHRLWRDTLPLDDVDSGAVDLAGRLAELVDRLDAARAALSVAQPMTAWAQAVAHAADALTATAPRDAWQRAELHRILDDLVREAADVALAVTPAEVRDLLADRVAGRPTRANFRTGAMTVCTLLPMRSVPHRVVCLAGLDDGAFPRAEARDGDDLLLRDPRIGERDPRSEDRQLLLDALMAATQTLVVTYTGNDERTNAVRRPAVPVTELLDAIEQTAGRPARDRVVVRHPLQPFDPRNFRPGALRAGGPWSFDRRMRDGAAALGTGGPAGGLALERRLPPHEEPSIALDDLVRFVEHPVKAFLRQRLGIRVSEGPAEPADELMLEPDGLARYAIGDRLLRARLAGATLGDALTAERARGQLPPAGALQDRVLEEIGPPLESIIAAAEAALSTTAVEAHDVLIRVGGRRVAGTVVGVAGDTLQTISYATLKPKHRLAAWVRLLALVAAEAPVRRAVTVGKRGDGAAVAEILVPDDRDPRSWALEQLAVLVDLRDRGLREPLPLGSESAAAWVAALPRGASEAMRAARGAWTSEFSFDKEDKQPEHVLAFGGQLGFDELWTWAAPAGEEIHWAPGVSSRFAALATRLWEGPRQWERS